MIYLELKDSENMKFQNCRIQFKQYLKGLYSLNTFIRKEERLKNEPKSW